MTDTEPSTTLEIPAFYDRLAADYDGMTGFDKRFVQEKPFFRLLVERYGIRTALDAGSGTGFHALLLAQLGVNVTAVDLSQEMLDRLGQHAREMKLHVTSVAAGFQNLRETVSGEFDAVFCLGNSIPHLLTDLDLRVGLESFFSLLRPGGILFLQLLNYDRILSMRERVQSVKENQMATFIRFYDYQYHEGLILFNLLKLERKDRVIQHSLISVPLRPVTSVVLLETLAAAGFASVQTFGGIAMDPFDSRISKDLVVLATRAS
jgi:SAM-dependent methyltransferase